MADEIKQVLGFDASQALTALRELDGLFGSFEKRLESSVSALQSFNTFASQTVAQLQALVSQANAAATALKNIPRAPTGGVALPSSSGKVTGDLDSMIDGLRGAKAPDILDNVASSAQKADKAIKGAAASTQKFVVSFETLSRVVFTQAIVRGLSQLRDAIREAFDSNIEFVRSLSLIQTIADPIDKNLGRLAVRTRELSDAFNVPLLEVTAGLYNTISNGFADAASSQEILITSLKFGKAAAVELNQSVDLITGTLNAFGLGADQAGIVAAKFFRTIDVGRVTGEELARAFGRTAPVAAELGVSISELDAAFAAITIQGVNANEAATEIRAGLTALLKPSDAAKLAFRELGVESAEQLIAAKGLQGAFKALISTTDGSSNAIAALFPNVRALNGILQITSEQGGKKFKDVLQEIEEAALSTLNTAFELRIETNAEKVTADLNKLKNFFTVEIGEKLVNSLQGIIKSVGGIESLVQAFESLVPAVVLAGGAMLLAGTRAGLLAIQTQLATASVYNLTSAFGPLAVAIAAVAVAGDFLGNRLVQVLHDAEAQFRKSQDKILEDFKSRQNAEVELEKVKNQKLLREVNDYITKVRRDYFKTVDAAKEANEQILADTKDVLKRIIAVRDKFAGDQRRQAEEATKAVLDSQERQLDAEQQLDDRRFDERNKRFNELAQASNLQKRAQELAQSGAFELSGAKTKEEVDAALSQFDRAKKSAEQALQKAESSGNRTAIIQAERTIQGILEKQIGAEKQLQALQKQRAEAARKAAADEEARVKELKQLAAQIVKDADLFGKNGPLPGDKRAEQVARANKNLDRFQELAFGNGEKLDVGALLDFTSFRKRLSEQVTGTELKQLAATGSAIEGLNNQIQGGLDKIEFLIKLAPRPDAFKGMTTSEGLDELSKQLGEQSTETGNLAQLEANRASGLESIRRKNGEILGIIQSQEQSVLNLNRALAVSGGFIGDFVSGDAENIKAMKEFAAIREQIQSVGADPNFDADKLNALFARLEANRKDLKATPFGSLFQIDFDALGRAMGVLKEIVEERKKISDDPIGPGSVNKEQIEANRQQLQELRTIITDPKFKEASDAPKASAKAVETSAVTIDSALSAAVKSATAMETASARTAANYAAAAQAASATSAAAAGAVTAAQGGLIQRFNSGGMVKALSYFNSGGLSQGTDTIPAMLSPGETVINAQSSRKFLSQLMAMNAGITPVFREQGGQVTNVGDINVNVTGGSTSTANGRDIAHAIRRELRRGTSVL